jgi:glutamine---fructose-6-phosphate transaminase (isomerizing)
MCGIIGVVANGADMNVAPLLIDGLKRLEYRGYDSAGIATLSAQGELLCLRSEGKISRLEQELRQSPIVGSTGIGHTRWATHGRPTRNNAHPHATHKVAVVHNGIIENFRELRMQLEKEGRVLSSDTDTEVIPHLITRFLEEGISPEEAVAKTIRMLSGSFALAILFAGREQFLIAARRGSPLAIGYGEGQMYIGSDTMALAPLTSSVSHLEDGDLAYISDAGATVWDERMHKVARPVRSTGAAVALMGKNGYRHYMLKEIQEQPEVLSDMLQSYIDSRTKAMRMPVFPFALEKIPHAAIVACGTSYYAGMVGKYWLERYAGLPVTLDIASEFRYRDTPLSQGGLSLFISQSGETADTLAALRLAREHKQHVMSLINVEESTMALNSDVILPISAGCEIGVASTKAFTTQLAAMACLTLAIADARKTLDASERETMVMALKRLPWLIMSALECEEKLRHLARELMHARNALYIGRGTSYPVALEGALKLKELTYIHAEGIAAGELKHGPIALIDEHMPVIAIAPSDALFEKTCSNIQEVSARGGRIIAFCDVKGAPTLESLAATTIVMPECHPLLAPIVYAVPMQLLAYHVAVAKGNDVDQPRNLAKSVTVE